LWWGFVPTRIALYFNLLSQIHQEKLKEEKKKKKKKKKKHRKSSSESDDEEKKHEKLKKVL
jgi:pre-mRNA-processing factor SLU7